MDVDHTFVGKYQPYVRSSYSWETASYVSDAFTLSHQCSSSWSGNLMFCEALNVNRFVSYLDKV